MPNVYVVYCIPASCGRLNVEQYAHLNDVHFSVNTDKNNISVDLLIGQDNAEALVPLDVRKGKTGEPFAVRTIFGWCLNGKSLSNRASRSAISNFIPAVPLESEVSKMWKFENERFDECSWSQRDKDVIELWDSESRKVDGHFEIPIP